MNLQKVSNRLQSASRQERGTNLVEAALLTPVFLLILLGVADLGMGFTTYISLTNAAREGTRWMTIYPDDRDGTTARIHHEIMGAGLNPTDVTIRFTPDRPSYSSGDTVTIILEHEYTLLFGAVHALPPIPFRINASMRVLYNS